MGSGDAPAFSALPFVGLMVDARGAIVGRTASAARVSEGCASFEDLFADGDRGRARRLVSMRFAGCSEGVLVRRDGMPVAVEAREDGGCFWVLLLDRPDAPCLAAGRATAARRERAVELCAAVLREIADPMSVVTGRLELLSMSDSHTPTRRHVDLALGQAQRVCETLRTLRMVGRAGPVGLDGTDLSVIAESALHALPEHARPRVRFAIDGCQVGGPAALYTRLLADALLRCLDVSRAPILGRGFREAEAVCVEVGGEGLTGPGVPDDGLEFHVAQSVLGDVGGSLRVERVGASPRFLFRLPPASLKRVRARPIESHLLLVGTHAFGDAVTDLLGRDGFATRRVSSAEEAWERTDGVDGVVTELVLPGLSGLALARALSRREPYLTVAVVAPADVDLPSGVSGISGCPTRASLLKALGRRARG